MTDLRFALRMLIKSPGFSIVAFLAIALGLGVNTTIFGIVNTLLLRPLPVGHSAQVVQVYTTDSHITGKQANSYLNFEDYRKQNSVFSAMAGYTFAGMGMTRGAETLNVGGLLVSGNYFDLLQVQPVLGRGFLPEEDSTPNGHPVAVLGNRFWKKIGGDPGVIGSTITLNGHAFTVIGVAPASFNGVDVGFAPDMWVPMAMHEWARPGGELWFEKRRALFLNILGRLKPGVAISQAEAQMKTVARQLEQAYPDVNKERSIKLLSLEAAKSQGLGGPGNENIAQNVSLLLLVAAGSILLIACANVANLLLARATTRQREMAVRLALGAGRGRIVRQLLTESILLAVIGGIGGVVLAYWFGDLLLSLIPPTPVPIALDPHPDFRVLLFAFALAVMSGVVFGLAPALQTARWDLTQGLRERASASGGGGANRWNLRNLLVIGQIAVSLLLLIGSALFLKAFHNAQAIDPGFRTQNLAILTIDPGLAGYDKTRGAQVTRAIVDQVRHDPRVVSADLNQWIPLGFGGQGRTIIIEGRGDNDEHNRRVANISPITPGYFETMAIPFLRGRKFNEHDGEKGAARVAVIDETMAKQFWPDEDPIGKRFRFLVDNESIEVIGIARNSKAITLGETPAPMVYIPFIEMPDGGISLFVHTASAPGLMLGETHRIVRDIDLHIPITYEKTIRDHMAFALWPSWMGAVILGGLGVLALILASVGVYGVMAYSVSQRTRELGIRMALGAQANQVLQLVLRQGMLLAVIGLAVGLFAAFASTRLASTFLYGVNPSDPLIFGGVTVVLAA
ncbi:MAG: ABC transporter permease, partial [Verrucomicrobiota bacterium]|nr:ABC transporter permease [Verrucomicrobiota bacterium]